MSDWARVRLWWGHKLGARGVPARRVPELLALGGVAILVTITLAVTTEGDGWSDIAHSQAVNVASAAAIASFAYVLFVLRFRRGELRDYMELCVSHPDGVFPTGGTSPWRPGEAEEAIANCVVEDTVKSGRGRSHLVITDVDASRRSLLVCVVAKLAGRKVVPVVLDLRGTPSASLATLARDRFVTQLVGAAGDPRNAGRLFAYLVQHRRLVVVVDGLERVAEAKPTRARREKVSELLTDCLIEGVTFVAAIDERLAPQLSEVSTLRSGRMSPGELSEFVLHEIDPGATAPPSLEQVVSGLFHVTEPTRDPGYLRLAIRLVERAVRAGAGREAAVQDVFADACAFRRHLRWMCQWAFGRELEGIGAIDSPESSALRAIGLQAHYAQSAVVEVATLSGGIDPAKRRRLLAGLARLVQREVVTSATVDGEELLRFSHTMAFAGALAVLHDDAAEWSELIGSEVPAATLDALTATLLLTDAGRTSRSFVATIRALGLGDDQASLDVLRAVMTALQAEPMPLAVGDEELEWMSRAWDEAGEPMRLRFVSDVDFSRHPRLVEFLWTQVVPPRFGLNSWRLRRAICRRLSVLGGTTWAVLADGWEQLVDGGAQADLSTVGRTGPGWRLYGAPIASLSWVLPTLLLRLDSESRRRADRLMTKLARVVREPIRTAGAQVQLPDIGLEVSLAEGFKVAAGDGTTPPPDEVPDSWRDGAITLFRSSRSWLSRLVVVQALGLTDRPGTPGSAVTELLTHVAADTSEHPFVREAAALLRHHGNTSGVVGQEAWLDDPETLDDGGLALSPAAHRLLGLSTLLVNLAENVRSTAQRDPSADGESPAGPVSLAEASQLRETALSSQELPRCFTRASHAATMFERPCDCRFRLCGPDTGLVGFRDLSRAFVQRSESVCRARPVTGTRLHPPFAAGAFRWSWRVLDVKLRNADRHRMLDR